MWDENIFEGCDRLGGGMVLLAALRLESAGVLQPGQLRSWRSILIIDSCNRRLLGELGSGLGTH